MLTEPASKASVPPTVVKRTRSRVPAKDLEPAEKKVLASVWPPMTLCNTQTLDPANVRIAEPPYIAAASVPVPVSKNALLCAALPVEGVDMIAPLLLL